MALRTLASGGYLTGGAVPSALYPMTITGKFTMKADRGNGNGQVLINVFPSDDIVLAWNDATNAAGSMTIASYNGGTGPFAAFASRPALNRPFFVYITCAGTGSGQLKAGWGYCDDGSAMVTVSSILDGPAANPTSITYSVDNFSQWANCNYGYLGVYPSVLTTAELAWERYSSEPVRPGKSKMTYFYPADKTTSSASVKDYSGNGADGTITGTLTIEPNAPVDDVFFTGGFGH